MTEFLREESNARSNIFVATKMARGERREVFVTTKTYLSKIPRGVKIFVTELPCGQLVNHAVRQMKLVGDSS